MIHFLDAPPSDEQLEQMSEALDIYIKLAVDVELGVLAGGGALHSDCEAVLLDHGCEQVHIWGADWIPHNKSVTFESLINIRPGQGNLSLEIQDPVLRDRVEKVVRDIFDDGSN
jgi:hypothetical protein